VNPRPTGQRTACTVADAKARLHDAEAFLAVTTMSEEPDVIATNAIHAAIAAADAICCVALRVRPSDGNHAAAVQLLSTVDPRFGAALKRALDRKTQAAYETRDISVKDAESCVRQAAMLADEARRRILAT
jgi:hypothetical protein